MIELALPSAKCGVPRVLRPKRTLTDLFEQASSLTLPFDNPENEMALGEILRVRMSLPFDIAGTSIYGRWPYNGLNTEIQEGASSVLQAMLTYKDEKLSKNQNVRATGGKMMIIWLWLTGWQARMAGD